MFFPTSAIFGEQVILSWRRHNVQLTSWRRYMVKSFAQTFLLLYTESAGKALWKMGDMN